jgi:hypothetical protein
MESPLAKVIEDTNSYLRLGIVAPREHVPIALSTIG